MSGTLDLPKQFETPQQLLIESKMSLVLLYAILLKEAVGKVVDAGKGENSAKYDSAKYDSALDNCAYLCKIEVDPSAEGYDRELALQRIAFYLKIPGVSPIEKIMAALKGELPSNLVQLTSWS